MRDQKSRKYLKHPTRSKYPGGEKKAHDFYERLLERHSRPRQNPLGRYFVCRRDYHGRWEVVETSVPAHNDELPGYYSKVYGPYPSRQSAEANQRVMSRWA